MDTSHDCMEGNDLKSKISSINENISMLNDLAVRINRDLTNCNDKCNGLLDAIRIKDEEIKVLQSKYSFVRQNAKKYYYAGLALIIFGELSLGGIMALMLFLLGVPALVIARAKYESKPLMDLLNAKKEYKMLNIKHDYEYKKLNELRDTRSALNSRLSGLKSDLVFTQSEYLSYSENLQDLSAVEESKKLIK